MHIFRRDQERRTGGGGEPPDVLLRLVVRDLARQQGGEVGVIHAGQEVGVQGVPLRAELAP